jgi:hypothetical protein
MPPIVQQIWLALAIGAALLLVVGAAMNASRQKDPRARRRSWVLCGAGLYLAIALGVTFGLQLRGFWFYVLWVPHALSIVWLFVNRRR